jgi:general secretion pathway protein D
MPGTAAAVRLPTTCKGIFMHCCSSRPRLPKIIFTALLTLLLPRTAFAQPQGNGDNDLLDQVRRMERVAAQKSEADVRRALREAERLVRTDRAKALDCLKEALARLDDETTLSPQRRESLKRMLSDRIRVTESDSSGAPSGVTDRVKKLRPDRGSEERRNGIDQEETRQSFKTIQQLQEEGKTEAASREASALARQLPQDTAVQAAERTTRAADQVANARRFHRDYERQLASGFRDIDRSTTLPSGDIDFPKDWKDRTKGRTAAIPLTAKERSILQGLNATISVNFKDSKLEDVIEYLQTYTGQPILLDREGMKDVEISYDTGVTLNVKGVTVRTLLRKILGDLGMAYVIKDETIQATSAQRARETMAVRRYYVGDLLAGMGALGTLALPQAAPGVAGIVPGGIRNFGALPFAAAANAQSPAMQTMQGVKQLIDLIQTSVDPQTWQANGGSGTITFHAPSMSLVIKQSAEVHALLATGGLLQ